VLNAAFGAEIVIHFWRKKKQQHFNCTKLISHLHKSISKFCTFCVELHT